MSRYVNVYMSLISDNQFVEYRGSYVMGLYLSWLYCRLARSFLGALWIKAYRQTYGVQTVPLAYQVRA